MTYRPNTTRGTGVDTLTARYIAHRDEADPVLDPVARARRAAIALDPRYPAR